MCQSHFSHQTAPRSLPVKGYPVHFPWQTAPNTLQLKGISITFPTKLHLTPSSRWVSSAPIPSNCTRYLPVKGYPVHFPWQTAPNTLQLKGIPITFPYQTAPNPFQQMGIKCTYPTKLHLTPSSRWVSSAPTPPNCTRYLLVKGYPVHFSWQTAPNTL